MEVSKEVLLKELLEISKKYKKMFPESDTGLTREFYLSNTIHKSKFKRFWDTFKSFKEEVNLESDKESLKLAKNIYVLKEEKKKLEKEKKLLLKEVISHELLIDLYKENLNFIYEFPYIDMEIKDTSKKTLLLNVSDIHLGEVVKSEDVNHVNEYNKDICIERLNTLFNSVIQHGKQLNSRTLHIALNGDLLTGGIHQELIRNRDLSEIESLFYLQNYLIQTFNELADHFNLIDVTVIVGNHSRIMSGKPYYKEKVKMNYEYILGMNLKSYYDNLTSKHQNCKIKITVPESPFIVKEVDGIKFLITHGDILCGAGTGGFLGLPAYSISMTSAKLFGALNSNEAEFPTKFDHILMGHLHSTAKIPIFNSGFAYINGCVCGTNEFSLYQMKSNAKKEQLLLILEDNNIHSEINIKL